MQSVSVLENITFCSLFTNRLRPFRDFIHHTVTSINRPSSSHRRHEMFHACVILRFDRLWKVRAYRVLSAGSWLFPVSVKATG